MKASLTAFQSGLQNLRDYLTTLDLEANLLAAVGCNPPISQADQILVQFQAHVGRGIAKRQFDYNSIVVSLYGYVEQFVEGLLRAYVRRLNAICSTYADVPEILRSHHVELTTSLLTRLDHPRYRDVITAKELVANLHSCLANQVPYALNAEAFVAHTANIRSDIAEAMCVRVGIPALSQRIRFYPPLAEYIATTFPDRSPGAIRNTELFSFLDDLADRRNEVAHGSPGEILENDLLREYIEFVETYAAALYEIASAEILGIQVAREGHRLGSPIAVYNNEIVCVALSDTEVKVGDLLVAETGNTLRPFIGGAIEEIQINGTSVPEAQPGADVNIAMRVECKVKGNHTFHLIRIP